MRSIFYCLVARLHLRFPLHVL